MIVDRTEQVKREMRRRAMAGMTVAGSIATDIAVDLAPNRTGALRKGIHAEVGDRGGNIVVRIIDSVFYAIFQEMGAQAAPGKLMIWTDEKGEKHAAKKIKATPHMRPMVDHMRKVFQGIIDKAVHRK